MRKLLVLPLLLVCSLCTAQTVGGGGVSSDDYENGCVWNSDTAGSDQILSTNCLDLYPHSRIELTSDDCKCVAMIRLEGRFQAPAEDCGSYTHSAVGVVFSSNGPSMVSSGGTNSPDWASVPLFMMHVDEEVDCGGVVRVNLTSSCSCVVPNAEGVGDDVITQVHGGGTHVDMMATCDEPCVEGGGEMISFRMFYPEDVFIDPEPVETVGKPEGEETAGTMGLDYDELLKVFEAMGLDYDEFLMKMGLDYDDFHIYLRGLDYDQYGHGDFPVCGAID